MFKSAFNYLAGAAADAGLSDFGQGGAADCASDGGGGQGPADPIVGSSVDVGGTGVRVLRRIGEGGFAFVYAVEAADDRRSMALKRLLAVDQEKKDQIVQEITFLKSLKPCPNVLQFIAAANLKRGLSATKCEEFLVLTELCVASMYDYLSARSRPYPPVTVARIFFQTLEAVTFLHRSSPPIAHRDLKIENLLIDPSGKIKLCDFGSATTDTYSPDESWNMQRRTTMEEDLARFTTPMYRAPEMVDPWSNFPVDHSADVWALGCLLFQLCFHSHPFEDGAKLRIINANFAVPESDATHQMFHDLVRQALVADPRLRPTAQQMQEHLGQVGVLNGWDLEAKIDYEQDEPLLGAAASNGSASAGNSQDPSPVHNNRQEQHQPSPNTERPPSSASSSHHQQSSSSFLSSFKGAGSQMLGKVRESTKVLVGTLMASRDLDLTVVTSKLVAMSFPSDGIDLTYKNQIDEVRQIIENHHADHYAVVNLTERRYAHSKFPRGKVIDADWSTVMTPTVEQVLKVTVQVLEFLGQHKQNVAILHCLDGRSNTAVLFSSLMLTAKVFSGHREALALFEAKRCEPVLSYGQRNVLKQLERALRPGKKEVELSKQAVAVTSVILEPVPLFTRAGDGVRPFADVYCDGKLVASTFRDYAGLQTFTPYDGEAVMRAGIKVPPGDVTVQVFHARQSFAGSLMSSAAASSSTTPGVSRIKICQVYFNPAAVSSSRSHVRFATHEVDGLGPANLDRIPADFSVSVNFTRSGAARTEAFPYLLPDRRKLDLIFASKGEYSEAVALAGASDGGKRSPAADRSPQRPPRREKSSDGGAMPKPSSLVDIASLGNDNNGSKGLAPPVSERLKDQNKPSSLIDISGADDKIVDNIFPENPPAGGKRDDVLLDFGGGGVPESPAKDAPDPFNAKSGGDGNLDDLLGGFSAQPKAAPKVPQPGTAAGAGDPTLMNDLFGAPARPKVPQPGTVPDQPLLNDFFAAPAPPAPAAAAAASDLFASNHNSGPGNLLGDLLAPTATPAPAAAPQQSASEKMVDDMLSNLNLGEGSNNKAKAPSTAPAAVKPNYSSAFFQQQQPNNNRAQQQQQPPSKATFEDLLGGFTPQADPNANKTIGEMKKEEDKKVMTEEEARIFEWTHGKSRNLRALLCSLHTVIWEGSRWEQCGMHQLVAFNDVKKMYRKACLAVHPDKQAGGENEELSKLVFTELNDGWSKFQEDEGAK